MALAVLEVLREAAFSALWSLLRGRPLGWQPAAMWEALVKAAAGRDRQERAFLRWAGGQVAKHGGLRRLALLGRV